MFGLTNLGGQMVEQTNLGGQMVEQTNVYLFFQVSILFGATKILHTIFAVLITLTYDLKPCFLY